MNEEIASKLLPLEPSEFADTPTPVELHPRLHQVAAWSMGTHPYVEVGQVWENLDASSGDEHGRQQALVTEIEGTEVLLVTVCTDESASRSNLGEPVVVTILDMRPEDGKSGWVQKSVLIPVNARGELRPDAKVPPRMASPGKIARRDPSINLETPSVSRKNKGSKSGVALLSARKGADSLVHVGSKANLETKALARKVNDKHVGLERLRSSDENIEIVTNALIGKREVSDEFTEKVGFAATKLISVYGFIKTIATIRKHRIQTVDADKAREEVERNIMGLDSYSK